MKEIFKIEGLNLSYGQKHVLKDIKMDIYEKKVAAVIGPSG